jgi:hypothetical protein
VNWNNVEGMMKAEKRAAIAKKAPETTFIPKYSKKLENRDFFKRLPQKIQGQLQNAAINWTPLATKDSSTFECQLPHPNYKLSPYLALNPPETSKSKTFFEPVGVQRVLSHKDE